jgi:hypothetical protein|tara:strand:- start:297 stop:674 length:378 start_codon:yes stop_codon:yes gene_type:complete
MKLPFCQEGEADLHSFQDIDLGFALSLKYDSISGLRTYNGQIILSEIANLHGWPDSLGEIPSDANLKKICDDYRIAVNAQEYSRKRKTAYDELNQLELMSDDSINGTTTHKDAILKVKSDYPKPE